ncbi:MAG: Rpp14/Pop5 family protein [Promethearchaeota archaeon]
MKTIRQRYVLFEIITSTKESAMEISQELIMKALWNSLSTLFGQKKTFNAGLWMIRWDSINRIGIVRVDNVSKLELVASMAFIRKLEGVPVIFHTRKTSGTVKKTLKRWREFFSTEPPKREFK